MLLVLIFLQTCSTNPVSLVQHLIPALSECYTGSDESESQQLARAEQLKSQGTDSSLKARFAILQSLAINKNATALGLLGSCYFNGEGVEQSKSEALKYWQLGSQKNDSRSMNGLGVLHLNGFEVKQDHREAVGWFEKAANAGGAIALVNLGDCYAKGLGVTQNPRRAFEYYQSAANKSITSAMLQLAFCYLNGFGVDKNPKSAFLWAERAANRGDSQALDMVGWCYMNGVGVEKRITLGLEMLKKSAAKQNLNSIKQLVDFYTQGAIVYKDEKQAFFWAMKGAQLSDPFLMGRVGSDYLDGNGTSKSVKSALIWLERSAEGGFVPSMCVLGSGHMNGLRGIPKNEAIGFKWLLRAAIAGDPQAMHSVAYSYMLGTGVKEDLTQARHWIRKCIAAGVTAAEVDLQNLATLERIKDRQARRRAATIRAAENRQKVARQIKTAATIAVVIWFARSQSSFPNEDGYSRGELCRVCLGEAGGYYDPTGNPSVFQRCGACGGAGRAP